MGLYLSRYLSRDLGKPKAALPPSAQQCGHRRPRRKRAALHTLQPAWDKVNAQRALAAHRLPSGLLLMPELSYARLSYVKRRLQAKDPDLQALVRVQVNVPVRPGSLYKCPPPEGRPDPCAKETVLQVLAQCTKGKRKFDGPLWFEVPEPKTKRSDPNPKPSAFQPVTTHGSIPTFVPKPGPLRRSCAKGNRTLGGGR
ncbi:POM121-like protein 2 [Cavia porcellus]|uniref:POM121-like protein 2 n=1 Tax=Cavia porcellus TaxID=10141 RepID=UPI002FE06421